MNIKNVLGDVYRIRDANGTEVAYYEYDAWGNITTKTGTMADINPFRYRGYYYDTETGFYYLQTRYYDSETRMFVNADNYEILGTLASTLGQLNLYTYCNNNPIMYTDESGEGILLSLILIGAIVGATVAGAIAHNNGVSGWELVGAIAGGALIGGALGALAYVAAPTIGAAYGYSAAMSLQATLQYAAGAMALGVGLVFSKGSGARFGHNQYENDQFEAAMKEIGGYKKTDYQWRKAHDALIKHKKRGNYISKYKDLVEFIKSVLGV